MSATIVWFRRDLRLADNPAWNWALQQNKPIIPVYIHAPEEEKPWPRGAASNWWLHHALQDLSDQLQAEGSHLLLFKGTSSLDILLDTIKQSGASAIVWNRCYEPSFVKRDTRIKSELDQLGIETQSMNGSLLSEPLKLRNQSGKPFQVFTPFWKHCLKETPPSPEHSIGKQAISPPSFPYSTCELEHLELLPSISWDGGISHSWNASRKHGLQLLQDAVSKSNNYSDQRDSPAINGTSQLSPYLHFGQISPNEFYHTVLKGSASADTAQSGILRQLYWREFSAHLLYHFPHSQDHALKPEYDLFPWERNDDLIRLWQQGQTGYPIVDAGMRQLWQTGWMHNRVRMVTASFLVKHLLQPWQEGARWFWDTLIDADLANNTMGWQWVAGSGADASPYFRIFNPILQSKKFDPDGSYIKTWIPELKHLPGKWIHTPWEAPEKYAAVASPDQAPPYPAPIIEHNQGRDRAMNAYTQFTESKKQMG